MKGVVDVVNVEIFINMEKFVNINANKDYICSRMR